MNKKKAVATGVKRLYQKRSKLNRWIKERAEFQAELDRKLADASAFYAARDIAYPERRIKELTAQIDRLSKEDLRTDQEKRGVVRKPYVRAKPIEERGMTDAQIDKVNAAARQMADERTRELEVPGSKARQLEYDMWRDSLMLQLKRIDKSFAPEAAKRAVAEKQGKPMAPCDAFDESSRQRIELLADLADLDASYSDCEHPGDFWNTRGFDSPERGTTELRNTRGELMEPYFDRRGRYRTRKKLD